MIPIGDSPGRRSVPWVTYALIAANALVFLYMFTLSTRVPNQAPAFDRALRNQAESVCYGLVVPPAESERFVCRWSFQPKEFFDNLRSRTEVPAPDRPVIFLSILTALFLHASWLHLGGNMLFLWVFGDNVEDRLGHARFLGFYLLGGIVASLTQGLLEPGSLIPVIGASGAVASVLGAYLLFFPRATVQAVIPFFLLVFLPFRIPAVLMIGLWFAQNLLSGYFALTSAADPSQGVAWFAHIGGFLFGLAAAWVVAGRRTPRHSSN